MTVDAFELHRATLHDRMAAMQSVLPFLRNLAAYVNGLKPIRKPLPAVPAEESRHEDSTDELCRAELNARGGSMASFWRTAS